MSLKNDLLLTVQTAVHEVCRVAIDVQHRWPRITEKEESDLVAILCTSEDEMSSDEVFARFEAQPKIRLHIEGRRICGRVKSQREHLDQMSQTSRWLRHEIPYQEAFPPKL